ncbi:MAG: hypothetical protein KDH84_01570 [Calditrichaeota bacterium]|nr:hypothetical protein [Calditrichota bacterium]
MYRILLFVLVIFYATCLFSQNDIYRRYNEYNMQPEVWQFSGVVSGEVDAKGDLNLSIPVLTVPGPNGLGFPINFSYKAAIKYHQQASWLGLGWNFDPGSITRDVQGNMKIDGTVYGVDYNSDTTSLTYLPDFYYASIPGKGTFAMFRSNVAGFNDHTKGGFYAPYNESRFYFEEHHPYKIDIQINGNYNWPGTYDPPYDDITRFDITADDGTKYIYGLPSLANYYDNFTSTPTLIDQAHPNVWRLLAIATPNYQGSISDLLQDDVNDEGPPYDETGWIRFDYEFDSSNVFKILVANNRQLIENTYLKTIRTPTHTAEFISMADRQDADLKNLPGTDINAAYRRLDKIILKTRQGDIVKQVKLLNDDDVSTSNTWKYYLGKKTTGGNGRLTLFGVEFLSFNNDTLPGYRFEYNASHNPEWSAVNTDYHYDGYGYYDTNATAPGPGKVVDDDTLDAQAWCLKTITFPTGGSERYEYYNDRIGVDSIDIDIFYDRNTSYSSDVRQNRFFRFEDPSDPNKTYRYQGGVRVAKIVRKDGMEADSLEINYVYGKGHIPIMPPKFIPIWLQSFQGGADTAFNGTAILYPQEFVEMNRGTMDVYYEWVKATYPDGATDSSNYIIGDPTQCLLYGTYEATVSNQWTLVTGFVDPTWGRIKSKYINRGDFIDAKTYTYDNSSKNGASVILYEFAKGTGFAGYNFEIKQSLPLILTDKNQSWIKGDENLIQDVITGYNYGTNYPTKQLTQKTLTSSGWSIVTHYIYAHDIDEYGGSTWDPDSLTGMRAQNIFTPLAREITQINNGDFRNVALTTYKEFDSIWRPHRVFGFDDKTCSSPYTCTFDDWDDSGGTISSSWKLKFEALDYKFGKLIHYEDGNGNSTKIFYGDNSHNLSNLTQYDSLSHAYITGIRTIKQADSLSKEFDYDTRFHQVNQILDENGNTQQFHFDRFGRLQSAENADGDTTVSYRYMFSRKVNGDIFDPDLPNYIKNTLFYSDTTQTVSCSYFNGLAYSLQSATRAGASNKDYYSAGETDIFNRQLREYKPYRKTSTDTIPPYDPDYRKREENGSLAGSETNRYTNFSYNSILDKELTRTEFPGTKNDDDNANRYYHWLVYADEELNSFYDSTGIVWNRTAVVDENGNESATFTDGLGNTVLERRYEGNIFSDGVRLDTIIAECVLQPGYNECNISDNTVFVLNFPQKIYWTCNITKSDTAFTAQFSIKKGGETILSINDPGTYADSLWLSPGTYNVYANTEIEECSHFCQAIVMATIQYYQGLSPLSTTYFEYDGVGNVTKVYPPNYFAPPTGSDSADWITAYTYNTLSQLTEKNSPDAGTIKYQYDANGNLIYTEDAYQTAERIATHISYDYLDRPLLTAIGEGTANDVLDEPANWISLNQYDSPPDPEAYPWYEVTWPSGDVQLHNLKNCLSANAYLSAGAWQAVLHSYDKNGRVDTTHILSEDFDPVRVTYDYDLQGLVTKTSVKYEDYALYHFYDYDGLGQLAAVYVSDNNIKPPLRDAVYTYNPSGTIDTVAFKEYSASNFRISIPYSYNIRDWLTEIGDITSTTEPFAAQYSYLDNGNIQIADFFNKEKDGSTPPRFKYEFDYDPLYRLEAADYSYYSGSWQSSNNYDLSNLSYDPNGNILTLQRRKESGSLVDNLTYNYGNDNNQLTSLSDAVGVTSEDWDAEPAQYTYDNNGNLTTVYDPVLQEYIFSVTYDERNLPIEVVRTNPGVSTTTIKYRYNAQGQRIYKKVGSDPAEYYILDGDRILGVFDEDGNLFYWNIFGDGVIGRAKY